ncbi:MAG: hypothetical protein Q9227_005864 [Pyrenula ochraceoflavens]
MSAPGPSQPGGQGEKAEGFSRVMRRMRTVLRRGRSKKEPISEGPLPASPAKETQPTSTTASTPAPPAATSVPADRPEPLRAPKVETPTAVRKVDANARVIEQREKAKRMFARHGLNLEDHEWVITPRDPVERVEKPIRMRAGKISFANLLSKGFAELVTSVVLLFSLMVLHVPGVNTAKLNKYPNGYPGDAPADEDSPTAREREPKKQRLRVSPKKIKPQPDPEVLKSLQKRLEELNVEVEKPSGEKS